MEEFAMNKLANSALIGALFTMIGGSIYFLFAVSDAVLHGGNLAQVVVDSFVGCLICWGLFTYIAYQVQQAFDEMNETGRRELEERTRREAGDNTNQPNDRL
jgi:hypothetical protein